MELLKNYNAELATYLFFKSSVFWKYTQLEFFSFFILQGIEPWQMKWLIIRDFYAKSTSCNSNFAHGSVGNF